MHPKQKMAVSQAFAIGALAFNAFAYLIDPLFGIQMDGIEYEPYQAPAVNNSKNTLSKPPYLL